MLGRTVPSHFWCQFGVFPAFLPLFLIISITLRSLSSCVCSHCLPGTKSFSSPGLAVLCFHRVSVSSAPRSSLHSSSARGRSWGHREDRPCTSSAPPSLPPSRFPRPHSPFLLLLLTSSGPLSISPFFFLPPLLFPPDYLSPSLSHKHHSVASFVHCLWPGSGRHLWESGTCWKGETRALLS